MRFATVTILAFSLAAGLPATAFDLTGHWEGSWSCTEFAGGVKTKEGIKESTFAVTSLGDGTFRGVVDGNYDVRGIEIPDAVKPEKGEIGFAHCGTSDDLANGSPDSELGRLKVSTSGSRGSLSGTSVWSVGPTHIATCKYKFTRVDTDDPGLTYPCP